MKYLDQVERELRIRKYSPKTINSYLMCLKRYFSFVKGMSEYTSEEAIKSFLSYLEKKELSASSLNLYLGALSITSNARLACNTVHCAK